MAHPSEKRGGDKTSEWVELEEKVPDQVGAFGNRGRDLMVTLPGKGKKGKKVKLRIPSSMIPELKRYYQVAFWDVETLNSPAGTASSYNILQNITPGTSAITRLGDAIYIEKIVIRLLVYQVTTITFTTANIAVVIDNEPAVGSPAWTDIWQDIGGSDPGAYDVAIPNYDKRFRFNIVREARIPLEWAAAYWNGSTALISTRPQLLVLDIPIKRRVMYNGATGAPYRGCNISVWGWSDANANPPLAQGSYEVFFRDA